MSKEKQKEKPTDPYEAYKRLLKPEQKKEAEKPKS
jgi:hypothetical protein